MTSHCFLSLKMQMVQWQWFPLSVLQDKAILALRSTGNSSIEAAVDFLINKFEGKNGIHKAGIVMHFDLFAVCIQQIIGDVKPWHSGQGSLNV